MSEHREPFAQWTILELLGHRRLAGYVSEQEIAGHGFLRIDIYEGTNEHATATQFYAPSSVYAITPTTEQVARTTAKLQRPEPVTRWELQQLEAPTSGRSYEDDDPDGPGYDEDDDPDGLGYDEDDDPLIGAPL